MSQTQTPRLVLEYRHTRMGGLSLPLALKVRGSRIEVVEPLRREFSRSGRHGAWIYHTEDVDVAFVLLQSNSGKRTVRIAYGREGKDVDEVIRRVVDLWFDGYSHEEVVKLLLGI